MKLRKLILPLLAASAVPANAALVLSYNFDGDTPGVQADATVLSEGGTVGSPVGAGTVTITAGSPYGGNYIQFGPSADTLEGVAAPHLNTGGTVGGLAIAGNNPYTMTAFVRFNNANNDNMIFGGNDGDVLHNGARGTSYYSGHWGDDLQGGTLDPGNWHHVAYTNDGAPDGLQEIFVDGVNVASGAGGGAFGNYTNDLAELLLIGTSRNQGSLNGDLDHVNVYDELLSDSQIAALARVPEPSGVALLGLSGLALVLRRRRS